MTMTRARRIELLAQELERSTGLPSNANAIIADMREGKLGPGFEAAIRAMQRAEQEAE